MCSPSSDSSACDTAKAKETATADLTADPDAQWGSRCGIDWTAANTAGDPCGTDTECTGGETCFAAGSTGWVGDTPIAAPLTAADPDDGESKEEKSTDESKDDEANEEESEDDEEEEAATDAIAMEETTADAPASTAEVTNTTVAETAASAEEGADTPAPASTAEVTNTTVAETAASAEEGAATPEEEGAATPEEEGAATPEEEGAATPEEEGAADANAKATDVDEKTDADETIAEGEEGEDKTSPATARRTARRTLRGIRV